MDVASDQVTSICFHCDRAIPSFNLDLHVAHCSRKLEKCKLCGDMVPKKHADEHFLSTHAPVSCSLCSETMEREVLAVHKGENCPQRLVACEYCEFPLPAIDLFTHQDVCGNRTELCQLCNGYIRLREIIVHASRCNGGTDNISESSSDGSISSSNAEEHFLSNDALLLSNLYLFWNPAVIIFAIVKQEACRDKTERCHLCSRYITLRERDVHESRCNGGIDTISESSSTSPAERDHGAPRRKLRAVPKTRLLFTTLAITGIAVLVGTLIFQRKTADTQVS
ncbi:hypothetical protein R3W88_031161 [Solanum pinnatisectum]|uniref:TRAF-type domain-containing protein n=1 Tax=Solanum pinnatisectum TaxID=50273 RepID=A0AAV9LNX6_9SOLN|nr:hypothetical protein R3W88_031161 [Solanum pinnatisectum]